MSRTVYVPLALAAALALPSCAQRGDHANNNGLTAFGQVHAAISAVPPNTFCVRIDAGTVSKTVDVTPGATASIDFAEVPIGLVQFAGFAFGQACAGLTPSAQPSYAGSASAAVQIGQITSLDLELQPVGGAHVGVGFGGTPDMSAPADMSSPPDLTAPVAPDLTMPAAPVLVGSPSTLQFHTGVATQPLNLMNQGNAPTGPLTFTIDNTGSYSVVDASSPPCAAGLAPGQSCVLQVRAQLLPFQQSGTLSISNGGNAHLVVSLLSSL